MQQSLWSVIDMLFLLLRINGSFVKRERERAPPSCFGKALREHLSFTSFTAYMGKLLQKIVNGIVPSWLTRVKSSAHASPKKLLPFSRGDTHVSSITSSFASDNILDHDHDHPSQSSKDEMVLPVTACAESSSVHSASPPSMQHKKTSMKQKDGKHEHSDDDDHHQHESHQFEDNNDHHSHHADMEECIHGMYSHATQVHVTNLLYTEQDGNVIHDKNCHPQYRHHQREVERPNCNNGCVQEDNKHNHKDYGHKAHNGHHDHQSDTEQKNFHDLLGFKRKSTYSKEDKDEEKTGGGNMKGWGWKRRKREEGLMSCELPESICRVVGNGKAVVKYSQEPQLALWESMVEMIVGNGLSELGNLEFLLFCYLSLNEPHLYPTIQSSFLQVLKDLGRTF